MRRAPSPRHVIAGITLVSLGVAGVLSVVWFVDAGAGNRYEPAVQSLGLLAGITGLVLERRAAAAEHRAQTVGAVAGELEINRGILGRSPFDDGHPPTARTVYPRLRLSAVDAALSSGALSKRADDSLVSKLHVWRDEVDTFNHQLTLAEILAFVDGSPQVLRDLHDGLHGDDGPLVLIRTELAQLQRAVAADQAENASS